MFSDLKAVIAAIAGLLLGAAVIVLYTSLVTLPSERAASAAAGKAESDAAWRELQHLEEGRRAAEKAATQAEIDAVEDDFHRQSAQREAQHIAEMTALDQALQEELANAPIPVPGAACRAAIPRSVRDRLDGIGRAAPRHDPAGAPAAVR